MLGGRRRIHASFDRYCSVGKSLSLEVMFCQIHELDRTEENFESADRNLQTAKQGKFDVTAIDEEINYTNVIYFITITLSSSLNSAVDILCYYSPLWHWIRVC